MEFVLNKALRDLDAHTAYLTPSAFNEMRVRTRGEFGGLGLEVTMRDSVVYVVAPIDDTPRRAALSAQPQSRPAAECPCRQKRCSMA